MDEHLLGVRINDQKAHLQKVLEEVRIANDELTKTFVQIEDAKKEYQSLADVLDTVRSQISDEKANLVEIQEKGRGFLKDASSKEAAATALLKEAESQVSTAQVRAELIVTQAQDKVGTLNDEIQQLEGFCESAQAQAATLTSEIGSLEQHKLSLTEDVKELQMRVEVARETGWVELTERKNALDVLTQEINAAQEKLEATRQETAALFFNLDQREKKVKVAEQDIEILKQRLYGLLKEQQSKL